MAVYLTPPLFTDESANQSYHYMLSSQYESIASLLTRLTQSVQSHPLLDPYFTDSLTLPNAKVYLMDCPLKDITDQMAGDNIQIDMKELGGAAEVHSLIEDGQLRLMVNYTVKGIDIVTNKKKTIRKEKEKEKVVVV